MKLSRRKFLGLTGSTSLLVTLSANPLLRQIAHATYPGQDALIAPKTVDLVDTYLSRLDQPHMAPLNALFEEAVGNRTIGFLLYDVDHGELLSALKPEQALPVASVFKAPLFLYFLDVISPDVWNSLPIDYWTVQNKNEVPEEYQAAWSEHHYILNHLYQMITVSSNPAVGHVLSYIGNTLGTTDPIAAFNDWSEERVGISQLSGLSSWEQGMHPGIATNDPRYMGLYANIEYHARPYINIMTPRDIGLYFMWYLENLSPQGRIVFNTIMSIIVDDRRGNIERLAHQNNGTSISKNGTLGPSDSPAGIVITDAGFIRTGNNRTYLVVLLSVNAEGDAVPAIAQRLDEVLRGEHEDTIQAYREALANTTDPNAGFEEFLASFYPHENVSLDSDHYNYGFVRREGVPVYYRPQEDSIVRNPVISSSRFGVHLVMQGALVRFVPIDDQWVQLVPDAPDDKVRKRLASDIFLKKDDLWIIGKEYTEPIHSFTDPDLQPEQKLVVIDILARELTALENDQVIFKTPIALSNSSTPRGTYPLQNKYLSRSMQAWAPGVPFTIFFFEGYAVHGSPWQRWEVTVTQENIRERISAGCVNIPNWGIRIGDYHRPVDELLFRWLGGLAEPEQSIFERSANLGHGYTRMYVVDTLFDVFEYNLPIQVLRADISWEDIVRNVESTQVHAPPSYFV